MATWFSVGRGKQVIPPKSKLCNPVENRWEDVTTGQTHSTHRTSEPVAGFSKTRIPTGDQSAMDKHPVLSLRDSEGRSQAPS